MKENNTILMLGVGSAGTRVAYYTYQRNASNRQNLRILGLDTDRETLEQMPLMDSKVLPATPALTTGQSAKESREAIKQLLDDYSAVDLIVVLTCLGGATSAFYTQEVLDYAKKNNIPAVAVAGMPHPNDDEEQKNRAASSLGTLQAQHFDILPLDCTKMSKLFPNQNKEMAVVYQQAVIWMCNTAMGYVQLFCEPLKQNDTAQSEEPIEYDELQHGIFRQMAHPTFYDSVDLDVPTYLRRKIKLPL